jgi:trehalose 6-phosphate phosphatase
MPDPLTDHLSDLGPRLRAAGRMLLFSDFDGTLVPIKDDPMACELAPDLRRVLVAVRDHPRAAVAVVSGRDLADLVPRVGVGRIAYAGNHGLEIAGPGFEYREPTAVERTGDLADIVAELTAALERVAGAWVQDKVLTASVHYRQVAPELVAAVREVVQRVVGPHLDRFVLRDGKMVLEVRPAVDWHKGRAVRWLADRLAGGAADPAVIFLGDDHTDEDAFAALPDGVTVMVGPDRQSAARYRVESPAEAAEFLRWVAGAL